MRAFYFCIIFLLMGCISWPIYARESPGANYHTGLVYVDDSSPNPLSELPYNQESFELAYKAFVFNGSVADAYALASAAVRENPDSIVWRERLLQTSLWTNHVDTAMDQLSDLIIKRKKIQYLPQAIKQASQFYKYESLLEFLKFAYDQDSGDSEIILQLAKVYDDLAMTSQAIELLKASNKKSPFKKFLEKLIFIYGELGDFSNQRFYLSKMIEKYGDSESAALDLAKIDYLQTKPKEALNQLNKLDNSAPKDSVFLITKAKLAWIVGDTSVSRNAYLKLYYNDKIDHEGILNLIDLQPDNDARQTIEIAELAWYKFHLPYGFLKMASLAPELRQWDKLRHLYSQPLTSAVQPMLYQEADYWVAKAFLIQHDEGPQAARESLLQSVLNYTSNVDLKISYFNFLELQLRLYLMPQNPGYMYAAAEYWKYKATSTFDWAKVYSTFFDMIHKAPEALQVYQDFQGNSHLSIDEPYWNATYIDILEKMNYMKSSYNARSAFWAYLQKDALDGKNPDSFWNVYASISYYYSPALIFYPLASYIAARDNTLSSADALMSYATFQEQYYLASYLAAYNYEHAPDYAVLNLAIIRNDQKKMHDLLLTPDALPRKERIHAAKQIGNLPQAQWLAHDAAKRRGAPDASDVYQEMSDLMLMTADNVQLGQEIEQFGSLIGPRSFLRSKIFITPKWSVGPYGIIWDARRQNAATLAQRSYEQKIAGVMFTRQTERSRFDIDIGGRENVYNNFFVNFQGDYRLSSRLTLDGMLNYNYISYFNNYMMVAGAQDTLQLAGNYEYTIRDFFQFGFEYDDYYLQDRTLLGNGRIYSVGATHKLWLAYPDYTIDFYGAIDQFSHETKTLKGPVTSIFLPDTEPSSLNFIPKNFWQASLSVNFGKSLRDNYDEFGSFDSNYGGEYSHDWRPYVGLGEMYMSTAGFGPLVDVGLVGSVFGRDKLDFYYNYSTLSQGLAQKIMLYGVRYQIYF